MQRRYRLLALASALLVSGSGAALAQGRSITVAESDTLEQLALRHGVDLQALIQLNGIRDPLLLQVGTVLQLPSTASGSRRPAAATSAPAEAIAPAPPAGSGGDAAAALLLSPAERRDRAELEWREQAGLVRWKWFNSSAVDWAGWKLHPGGVRITLVKASQSDLGLRGSGATAVAVHCTSLRQNWRIDGSWQGWHAPQPGGVGQRIVLDLCSNTLDGPAVPVPPPP